MVVEIKKSSKKKSELIYPLLKFKMKELRVIRITAVFAYYRINVRNFVLRNALRLPEAPTNDTVSFCVALMCSSKLPFISCVFLNSISLLFEIVPTHVIDKTRVSHVDVNGGSKEDIGGHD